MHTHKAVVDTNQETRLYILRHVFKQEISMSQETYKRFSKLLDIKDVPKPIAHQRTYNTSRQYLEICKHNILAEFCALKEKKGDKVHINELKLNKDDQFNNHLFRYGDYNENKYFIFSTKKLKQILRATVSQHMYNLGYVGTYIQQYDCAQNVDVFDFFLRRKENPASYKDFKGVDSAIPCNKGQKKIIKSLTNCLELVQGPPGTGKSTTIYHLIKQRMKGKTLVTSRNNQAIAAVIEKLKSQHVSVFDGEGLHLVVEGNISRIPENIHCFHVDVMAKDQVKKSEIIISLKEKTKTLMKEINKLTSTQEKIRKKINQHLTDIMLPDLEKKRLLVFVSNDSDIYYVKGRMQYLDRLKSRTSYIRDLENNKIEVSSIDPCFFSSIEASQNQKGPFVFWKRNFKQEIQNLHLEEAKCIKELNDRMQELQRQYESFIRRKSTVFLTTISSSWRVSNIRNVIVDEAGTVEEESIPMLCHTGAKNFIFIGDHKQLRPFSNIKANNPLSFFERMIRNDYKLYTLTVQYRMAKSIGKMVSETFYKGKLQHATKYEEEKLVWCNHTFDEEACGKSWKNTKEAELVSRKVREYKQAKPEKHVMVITFYRGQLDLLKEDLSEICDVNTVDSSQGMEAEAVFLSCVRSNKRQTVGFTSNINRLCVALSRAKESLIIIGNRNTFSKHKVFKRIMKHVNML